MGSSHGQTTPRRTRVSSPHMSVKVNHLCRSTLVDGQQASRSFVTRVTVVAGKEQRRREGGRGGGVCCGWGGGRAVGLQNNNDVDRWVRRLLGAPHDDGLESVTTCA